MCRIKSKSPFRKCSMFWVVWTTGVCPGACNTKLDLLEALGNSNTALLTVLVVDLAWNPWVEIGPKTKVSCNITVWVCRVFFPTNTAKKFEQSGVLSCLRRLVSLVLCCDHSLVSKTSFFQTNFNYFEKIIIWWFWFYSVQNVDIYIRC